MGKGGQQVQQNGTKEILTWTDVKKHSSRTDKWIVVEGEVYDVTKWSKKHPGGSIMISHYAGQDASVSSKSLHFLLYQGRVAGSKYGW